MIFKNRFFTALLSNNEGVESAGRWLQSLLQAAKSSLLERAAVNLFDKKPSRLFFNKTRILQF
jgi:hypothetical protein